MPVWTCSYSVIASKIGCKIYHTGQYFFCNSCAHPHRLGVHGIFNAQLGVGLGLPDSRVNANQIKVGKGTRKIPDQTGPFTV